MLALFYTLCIILGVLAITYPKEFPTLMRSPEMFIQVVALETRRRWMMARLWPMLQWSKLRMRYSHWKMRDIIKAELAKQQAQEANDID